MNLDRFFIVQLKARIGGEELQGGQNSCEGSQVGDKTSGVICKLTDSDSTTPLMSGLFLIIKPRSSTAMTNNRGEAQHPCRTPLAGKKKEEVKPALIMQVSILLKSMQMELILHRPGPRGGGESPKQMVIEA